MKIEEIWPHNAWRGLWGEVVEADIYKIKQMKFAPDVIFDIGANVGTFSRFAREIFPNAIIIAVEPDDDNIKNFMAFNNPDELNVSLHKAAIGIGRIFKDLKEHNGSGECYISEFLGYEGICESEILAASDVKPIMLDFFNPSIYEGKKYMLKIDIEGAETAIFTHEPSMEILRNADYIAMELHYFSASLEGISKVKEMTEKTIESLKETHDTIYEHPMFYATKK